MSCKGLSANFTLEEQTTKSSIEIWGGIECTINRVEDEYFEQLKRSGHYDRITDLDLFASLGVKSLRYPVLWEMLAASPQGPINWTWPDIRINRLRELNVRPIIGFLHHGSGPRYASVIDENFPNQLARFAGEFASRYPWVEAYTPVNEPLTTARFCGLYGHWHPHGTNDRVFLRFLLNECKAIVLSMRAIKRINPAAQLIQTEDMGRMYSTPHMKYQADFENERRWLGLDLLTGRVMPGHPLWEYLKWAGCDERELLWFGDNPCPPDIIGIDHYLTSNRYLDENCDLYPADLCGTNGRDRYVDVEAIRVNLGQNAFVKEILQEVWERYRIPLAITEAHLGCTREEQLRWLFEIWRESHEFAALGGDMRAVTAWALLGSFDWDSLLTKNHGNYESGAFDVRSETPRPTALAHLVRDLALTGDSDNTVLSQPGWWRRRGHAIYAADPGETRPDDLATDDSQRHWWRPKPERPIVILGTGNLGTAFSRICESRALHHEIHGRASVDITDASAVEELLQRVKPWAVVNAAGYVDVDGAELDANYCHQVNVAAAAQLAEICSRHGSRLLAFSSHMVFGGTAAQPYVESDVPTPLNVYGRSKALMETAIRDLLPEALIIRSGPFFGPWDETNFVTTALRRLASGTRIEAIDDIRFAPSYIVDVVQTSLDLLIDGESGIWHLVNDGCTTWAEMVMNVAKIHELGTELIFGRSHLEFDHVAPRPAYSVLTSERACLMPALEDALHRYRREVSVQI